MSKSGSKNTVRFRICDNFQQFWFRFIERNRPMIELDNYADLLDIVMHDFPTYSGLTLEKYFRQKLVEKGGFRELGSWWERKAGKEANEIDIVGIRADGKSALVAQVKHNARNYDNKLFMEKLEHIKAKILSEFEI
ncbi:MAG: DUF234 domain-containing protein [Prevotella sp.]|nr:DUF234 domain-containing protein [Prevotella sp.]